MSLDSVALGSYVGVKCDVVVFCRRRDFPQTHHSCPNRALKTVLVSPCTNNAPGLLPALIHAPYKRRDQIAADRKAVDAVHVSFIFTSPEGAICYKYGFGYLRTERQCHEVQYRHQYYDHIALTPTKRVRYCKILSCATC